MAIGKHERKKSKDKDVKEVIIREKTGSEYYDDDDFEYDDDTSPEVIEVRKEDNKLRKQIILIIVLVLVLFIGVFIFMMKSSDMTAKDLFIQIKTSLMGSGSGDGYPVSLTGSDIGSREFFSVDGNVVTLSNTALTVVDSTGKEKFSSPHSFNSPAVKVNGGKYLLYDCGGTSYDVISSTGKKTEYKSESQIIAADISSDGKIALASYPSDYTSQVQIYSSKGALEYTYKFSVDYASAVSFNDSGDMCAVACVYTSLGEAYTRIVVLEFDKEEPVSEYVFSGNFVTSLYWSGKTIYAVGDEGIAVGSSNGSFSEYSFDGQSLTALQFADGKAYLSTSGYSHSGASTLLIFSGSNEPKQIDLESRIVSISASGNMVAVLAGNEIYEYSVNSLELVGKGESGTDANAVAIQHSGSVYVLGGKEIRLVVLSDPQATEEPTESEQSETSEQTEEVEQSESSAETEQSETSEISELSSESEGQSESSEENSEESEQSEQSESSEQSEQ